jgi:adenine-specific DNA-methyltransferase
MFLVKTPSQSLTPAVLKIKPSREQFEQFKTKLAELVEQIKASPNESEEHHKNHVSDFLKYAFKSPAYFINTKYRNDLVVHNGKAASDSVGIIIEAKSPKNQAEMPTRDNLNVKAMQELVLYFLRERVNIMANNYDVKHLIICNGYEWFVFDAQVFEKAFVEDKALIKQFNAFQSDTLSGNTTDFFYKNIAKPAIGKLTDIEFTHFDLRDKHSDKTLIALFKFLSPEHLLKLPFVNDSNSLNKDFYAELLHIIGLVETKEGSKKLIQRKKDSERNRGSLLENAIHQLDELDKLRDLDNPSAFGATKDDQLFNVGLELVITWVNRILFLKLLEAQLITYHKDDASQAFLNSKKIGSYAKLNELFFSVLARKPAERDAAIKAAYANVPYLNSSLFEQTDIERKTFVIRNLTNEQPLPLYASTVLKNINGKRRVGELNPLQYLLEFLEAYDFSSEGKAELKDDNKALINASVLGLIFEKINGYKDGSFFTPGFITMYMCREALRRAVVQKFNDVKGWTCKDIAELDDKIETGVEARTEANQILNSLKICDPAVGSGHFLVSALNELIALKSELGILQDSEGKRLKNYAITVVHDELMVRDEDGDEFAYSPTNVESARIQKTLFHEKQTLIENCLFGVDINPNSVKICRLRLWIELLKNAYYNADGQLETLPNIDINIKVGNSLISRYALDVDLKEALKKNKLSVVAYRQAVQTYRNAASKEQKFEMERLIADIKNNFRSEMLYFDPKAKRLENLRVESRALELPQTLLEETAKDKKERLLKLAKLKTQFDKLDTEIEEIKSNKIYQNAFEWRFEFPEVLDDDGAFVGFDVVIGNPPYGVAITGKERECLVSALGKVPDYEIYYLFINRGMQILCAKGRLAYITPNSFLFNVYAQNYRVEMLERWGVEEILDCTEFDIFSEATVRNVVFRLSKNSADGSLNYRETQNVSSFQELISRPLFRTERSLVDLNIQNWGLIFKLSVDVLKMVGRVKDSCLPLMHFFPQTSQGLIAYDKHTGQSEVIIKNRIFHSLTKNDENHKPWLYGEDVTRYCIKWNGREYVNYCEGIANPRDPKYFRGERILVREITSPVIYAGYTNEELYNDPSVIVVLKNSEGAYSLFSLLGILNSKFATFFHFNSSPKATKGAFPKILVYDINNFPLPRESIGDLSNIIHGKVDQILALKKQNPSTNTSALEKEIDQLVYALYALTPEEIAIVEGRDAGAKQ